MGIAFDGLLGLHIIFALAWVGTSFVGARLLLRVVQTPNDSSLRKRALLMRTLIAATGGITILVGAGFYYYINFYRTSYATSSSGVPLIDAGALLGVVAFAWQMSQGPRIKRALSAPTSASSSPVSLPGMPKNWMIVAPGIVLLLALLLMIGGSMM